MRYTTRRRPASLTFVSTALALTGLTSWAAAQDPAPPAAPADPAPAPAASVEANAQLTMAASPPVVDAPAPAPEPVAVPGFDVKVDFGVGLRTELAIDPDAEPESPLWRVAPNLRPYIAGQVHDYIKFEGNVDTNGGGVALLDAIIKFEFHEYFNLWTGRFLPPSDRANLSGPYFQNAWNYPVGTHLYPAVNAGRDDGLAVWGQVNGGQFKWQLGLFGMGAAAGTPDPRFAARVVYNVLDPEPGYYNSSTYYGTKDILAFGAVLQHQPDDEATAGTDTNTLWNLDALYENSFPGTGTLNVEAAFYGFGGNDTGNSFSLLGSFLFADRVGIGQLQPMVRLQRAWVSDGDTFVPPITAPADGDASLLTIDVGLHYIINGHNTRLAATVQHTSPSIDDAPVEPDSNTVLFLGAQVQAF